MRGLGPRERHRLDTVAKPRSMHRRREHVVAARGAHRDHAFLRAMEQELELADLVAAVLAVDRAFVLEPQNPGRKTPTSRTGVGDIAEVDAAVEDRVVEAS